MTLYNVSTFEETSRQIGELWRTLDRVHDTLGQSTGATQVLTQQMSEMGRIQGEQGKTLQTVLEQYKGVVQAQAATTMAVEENSENTARLADAVGKFGEKLDTVSSDYMPATKIEALFEKQGAMLETICERTAPIIEEQHKRVEKRKRWADGFEKWKIEIAPFSWTVCGLVSYGRVRAASLSAS